MRHILGIVAVAGLVLAACSDPGAPELSGQWGGAEANLRLTPAGGSIEYGCGAGTIDSGWTVTAGGRWSATGQHYFGGGPVPAGGGEPHPAVYRGRMQGSLLTVTVAITDLPDSIGPLNLERGRTVALHRCL